MRFAMPGRWLAASDEDRLAPAIVVDDPTYTMLGRPPLGTATLTAYGLEAEGPSVSPATAGRGVPFVVIGVLPRASGDQDQGMRTAFVSSGALAHLPGGESALTNSSYLVWVPPEVSEQAQSRLTTALDGVPGGPIDVHRMGMSPDDLGFGTLTRAVAAVAGVVLLLGAMGLVNISLVTVRHRMREIGIRRSYGATGPRIFVGVLMESVVATTIAGIIGVTAAVALMRAPFVLDWFASIGLVDLPPFPVSAVAIGLASAIAVGALAGIVPALIATRVRVIDAIRA